MLGAIKFLQHLHFARNFWSWAKLKRVSENRLCAPVATKRAATAAYDIQGKRAMRRLPGIAIEREVDQIPCRDRQVYLNPPLPIRTASQKLMQAGALHPLD